MFATAVALLLAYFMLEQYWNDRSITIKKVFYHLRHLRRGRTSDRFYLTRMTKDDIVNFFNNDTIRKLMERHISMGYDCVSYADMVMTVEGLPLNNGRALSVILMTFRPFEAPKYNYFNWSPPGGMIWMINPCYVETTNLDAKQLDALRTLFREERIYRKIEKNWDDVILVNYRTIVPSGNNPRRYKIRDIFLHPIVNYQALAFTETVRRVMNAGTRCFFDTDSDGFTGLE